MAFVLLILLVKVTLSQAFQWNSAASLPNDTSIPACTGSSVALMWNYTLAEGEQPVNVEWHFTSTGSNDDKVLATEVSGNLFLPPGVTMNVQFIPNAGIRLLNVGVADSGTYSVHVNVNLHGAIVTEVQTVHLHVSDSPLLREGELHAVMTPEAVYDNTTQQFHIQLECRDFHPMWASAMSILWKTPDDQTVNSTFYENGRYFLTLPNPVTGGDYTCVIDDSTPAALCLKSDSPLRRGATVTVDGIEARFMVTEGKIRAEQKEVDELKGQFAALTETERQVEQEKADFRLQLNNMTSTLESFTSSRVSFQASLPANSTLNLDNGGQLVLTEVQHNEGGCYDNQSGNFTTPVDGVYMFLINYLLSSSPRGLYTYVALRIDHAAGRSCTTGFDGYYDTASCTGILHLKAGRRVRLTISSYTHDATLTLHGGVFSITLIRPDSY